MRRVTHDGTGLGGVCARPIDASDDASLVERILAGERAAFTALMRRFNRRLFRLARAVLRDEAEAEDAVQESYLTAYRAIGSFRGDSSLATWLSRLVLNEAIGRARRRARRDNVIPMVSADTELDVDGIRGDSSGEPDRLVGREQLREVLQRQIDALPESFRTVFVMRSVEELSVEETAACLGLPEATVRSRHSRAKSRLRESLTQAIDLAERDVFDFGNERCDRLVQRVLGRI